MLHNSFSKEIVPSIQPKLSLTQLEAIASCPLTGYLGEHLPYYTLLSGSCREQ